MPRFFLSGGSSIAGGTAFILGEDAAHAKVLRLRVGDTMIVCDGGKDLSLIHISEPTRPY